MILENIVKKSGDGAHVTVPKSWIGKRVQVSVINPQ